MSSRLCIMTAYWDEIYEFETVQDYADEMRMKNE